VDVTAPRTMDLIKGDRIDKVGHYGDVIVRKALLSRAYTG